jgi:hypothetical protein
MKEDIKARKRHKTKEKNSDENMK